MGEQHSPAAAVLAAVADARGTDQLELPPLYEAVDPDVLDQLLPSENVMGIEFQYADYNVALYGGGDVTITASD